MTVSRTSLEFRCTTKGCPWPRDEEIHIPWCRGIHECFGGATHQHYPKKGMGGNNPKSKIVAIICAGINDQIDNGPLGNMVLDIPGQDLVYRIFDYKNETMLYRILESRDGAEPTNASGLELEQSSAPSQGAEGVASEGGDSHADLQSAVATLPREGQPLSRPSPSAALTWDDWLTQDWSVLSDDELQAKYDAAEKMQGFAYLLRCKAVHAYRENHAQTWGESWTDQAIERFGISRRTCEAHANIWQITVSSDAYIQIAPLTDSRSLMQYIGRQPVEKGAETMEAAIAHFAEYAEPPTVKALANEEQPERERHSCPTCGYQHWAVVEAEWKV